MAGQVDADIATVAALMADRTRCAMLNVLMDGTERPAGELARATSVSPATASGHLQRMVAGGLLRVRQSGRHRYYGLSGAHVAAALEVLALIAPPIPVRSVRTASAATALAEARTCYDHIAGRLGVQLRSALVTAGAIVPDVDDFYTLTTTGWSLIEELDIDPQLITSSRRMLARDCLDWTERRPHLAGALPARLLERFIKLHWVKKRGSDRGLTVTDLGRSELKRLLGFDPGSTREPLAIS